MRVCSHAPARVVGDGACEEQIFQHEEIVADERSHPRLALRGGVLSVAVKEVIVLEILDLAAVEYRLMGNRLGDVGFPGARFADEQRVLAGGNGRQCVELEAKKVSRRVGLRPAPAARASAACRGRPTGAVVAGSVQFRVWSSWGGVCSLR